MLPALMRNENFIELLSDLVLADFQKSQVEVTQNDIAYHDIGKSRLSLTEAQKERIWQIFVKRADVHEKLFKKEVIKLFKQQEKEVLDNMPEEGQQSVGVSQVSNKASISDWLFGKRKWRLRFAEMGQLLLPQVIEETGGTELGTLVVGVDFDVANPRVTEFVSKRTFKFAGDVNDTTIEAIRAQLLQGIADGEGIPKLRKRVQEVFADATRRRSEMIARSEVIRASNFGAEEAYIQSAVCEGKEWLTALDERTCVWCEDMNGKTMALGKSFFDKGDSLTVGDQAMNFDYDDIQYAPLHPQ